MNSPDGTARGLPDAPGAMRSCPEGRAPDELVQAAYARLHELARGRMRHERRGHLLQTTALVHEAYLRLLKDAQPGWTARQYLIAAAEAMRRILVEQARERGRRKRGGGWARVPLESLKVETAEPDLDLDMMALDEALKLLAVTDARMHEIVLLRFFAGLEIAEIARAMGLSSRTIDREWKCARLWLYQEMTREGDGS